MKAQQAFLGFLSKERVDRIHKRVWPTDIQKCTELKGKMPRLKLTHLLSVEV